MSKWDSSWPSSWGANKTFLVPKKRVSFPCVEVLKEISRNLFHDSYPLSRSNILKMWKVGKIEEEISLTIMLWVPINPKLFYLFYLKAREGVSRWSPKELWNAFPKYGETLMPQKTEESHSSMTERLCWGWPLL